MKVIQSAQFSKRVKKLHKNKKKTLDNEIREIMDDPRIAKDKNGDLTG